jgi:hypothetical protein
MCQARREVDRLLAITVMFLTRSQVMRKQPTTAVNAPLPSPDPIITVAPNQLIVAAPMLAEAPKPLRIAKFGKGLGRAVTEGSDEERVFEAPTDTILDRVQFLVNNLAPSNVEKKAAELKECFILSILDGLDIFWLSNGSVVKQTFTRCTCLFLIILVNMEIVLWRPYCAVTHAYFPAFLNGKKNAEMPLAWVSAST